MLKLEREKRGHNVHVRFRKNNSFFTPLFWKALAAALAFHVLGVLIFHIQPFSLSIFPVRPPVKLYLEPFFPLTLVNNDSNVLLQEDSISAPSLMNLEFPSFPLEGIETGFMTMNDFSQVPVQDVNFLQHATSPMAFYYYPIQVMVSGTLAERELFAPAFINEMQLQKKELHSFSVRYHVRVDAETGRIFWYALDNEDVSKTMRQEAEKILRELQFSKDPGEIEIEGAITFVFTE